MNCWGGGGWRGETRLGFKVVKTCDCGVNGYFDSLLTI